MAQEEDVFPLPRQLVGDGPLFLLKVTGDAMADAGIADGDWLFVRQQKSAGDGEIVAAMVAGDAVARTYVQRDGDWLVASDPGHAPVPAGDATVIGAVVAILRSVARP